MAVRMAMSQHARVSDRFRDLRVKLSQQNLSRIESHEHSSTEQQTTDTQRTDALDLSVAIGESVTGGFEGPGDSPQGQEVGDEVGERVVGVGNQSLRVKDVAADEFSNCHTEVGEQPDPRDANTSVAFI